MAGPGYPKVSIIIPTLNAAALLDNCLASIAAQTYPRDRIEIVMADAFSRDATREIGGRYGALVIDDHGKNMEEGKRLALAQATGEFIVFVDADNELTHPDYLELAVRALQAHPQALGVESYYLPSPKMSSFCRYVTARLHISDPLSWLMTANPVLVARDGEVERWTLPGTSCSYPLGANGFVFRRSDLDSVQKGDHFQDTHAALHLMKAGKREWLRIRGRGVHHYYIQSLLAFIQKRRRAVVHYLRVQEERPVNWMRERPPMPVWLAGLYCVTGIGPLYHTVRGLWRDRDPAWLWHLPACPGSVLGTAWGVWTHRTRRGDRRLVADLQVKQELRKSATNVAPPTAPEPSPLPPTPTPPLSDPSNRNSKLKNQKSSMSLVHFITNGVFSTTIAGGDIHFLKLAEGAAEAGYSLNFFGGHALREVVAKHGVPGTVTLTDDAAMPKVNQGALGGQVAMFRDMYARYRRTLAHLDRIGPDDYVYAVSDYWFDVIPAVRSRSRRPLMVLHMEAPTLGQILTRSRPDVDPKRLASLHYWASQEWSLRRFGALPRKHILHLHPLQAPRLRALGVRPDEMTLVSYGLEVGPTEAVPPQERIYDAVWIGRVHRQKGIDDLLATLRQLADALPDFRAMFIGNVRDALAPEIAARGLTKHVEFSGFVSEEEKIRLFKASRVFLMPSKHEGSPRVIGESIIAGTPVVAYDVPNYRPLFGDFVRYAPAFDLAQFQAVAGRELQAMRRGENYLERMDLGRFKEENRWETVQAKFVRALRSLEAGATTICPPGLS